MQGPIGWEFAACNPTIHQACSPQERPHQCKDAFFFGKSTKEQEIRLNGIELIRVGYLMCHVHLAGGQEVLHGHGSAGISTLIQLVLHEFTGGDDFVDLVVGMMVLQEFRFKERQTTLRFRSFHTSFLHRMEEVTVKAIVANLAGTVHHRVSRAQQNIVVRCIHHRNTVLLQIRRIQNRQSELAMHIIYMNNVWLEFFEQRLKLALRFEGIHQRRRFLHFFERGNLADVVLFGYEILAPITRLIVWVLHGEERNLMAECFQSLRKREEICFSTAFAVEIFVDQ